MTALEYVLGTLPAAERAAFARQAETDPAARAALDDWERRLAPMAAAVEPVEPDAAVWSALEGRIDPPAVGGGNVVELRRSLARWRFAATAVSALAASLALYVTVKPAAVVERTAQMAAGQPALPSTAAPTQASASRSSETGVVATASASRQNESLVVTANGARDAGVRNNLNIQPAREAETAPAYVAALAPSSSPAALIARVDPSSQAVVVRRLSGAPPDSELRLWLLAPGAPPRALGFAREETTRLALPRDVALAGASIAATVEPAGTTSDAPNGPYVYEGRLVRE